MSSTNMSNTHWGKVTIFKATNRAILLCLEPKVVALRGHPGV